jgi:exodeoxyribonuclease-3
VPEREALKRFEHAAGVTDVVRERVPEGFTFWDYKQGKFAKDHGLRIDFIFGTPTFAERVVDARIHREERASEGPSDHVPVVVELGGPSDDDDRPMVF